MGMRYYHKVIPCFRMDVEEIEKVMDGWAEQNWELFSIDRHYIVFRKKMDFTVYSKGYS